MSVVLMPTPTRDQGVVAESGLRLARLREVLGLTQEQLAAAIGVQRTTLANWETAVNLVDPLAMARMSARFGPVMEWIYSGAVAALPFDRQQALLGQDEASSPRRRA